MRAESSGGRAESSGGRAESSGGRDESSSGRAESPSSPEAGEVSRWSVSTTSAHGAGVLLHIEAAPGTPITLNSGQPLRKPDSESPPTTPGERYQISSVWFHHRAMWDRSMMPPYVLNTNIF